MDNGELGEIPVREAGFLVKPVTFDYIKVNFPYLSDLLDKSDDGSVRITEQCVQRVFRGSEEDKDKFSYFVLQQELSNIAIPYVTAESKHVLEEYRPVTEERVGFLQAIWPILSEWAEGAKDEKVVRTYLNMKKIVEVLAKGVGVEFKFD